ncbi:MAG: B12-binding domain-containing radical SAM protein [Deltaproteobacteria bacterium]|nr:B12-binding domain-containing radical SAM protein [Deltaproteobacteria bacterium]
MDVAFVSLRAREPLAYGLMSLAGALRARGHRVAMVQAGDAGELRDHPEVRRADVIGLSATTGLHRVYVDWARRLRRCFPHKALVMGGPHPSFFPQVIEHTPLDGICIGEGEESFPEFLELLAEGLPRVPDGFWIRRDHGRGPVERGKTRAPPRDLDALPSPSFELFYDAEPRYRALPIRIFLATRGCPFRCSYCFNHHVNERNRPFGPLLRAHDPERLVDEIARVLARWGGRTVWFLDANFVANRRWLEAFAPIYARRIGLPFFCKLRPERASERVVETLVSAGCTGVGVGIESGNERSRREVLARPGRDAEILEGCRLLKRAGIRIMSFSMLGIPGETLDDALRTVALNVACGVDYAGATILQPYPGTPIARWAVEHGHFDGDYDRLSYSYFAESPFRFPSQRDRDRITNLQRLFAFAVEFPEVRARIRRLIDRPPSAFYRHLFEVRHHWALQRGFYRGFTRLPPAEHGTIEQLRRACGELALPTEPPDEAS